jgi:hypothetical protein
LVGEEAGRLHRRLVAVIKIARQEQGINLLIEAEIHDTNKRPARGISNEVREFLIPQRKGTKWRVEMDISRVDETKCHGVLLR